MFRIVYDVKNSRIYFRTRANSAVRFLDFKKFDFACGTPVKVLNISSNRKGDVTAFFTGYSFKANHELIKKSFSETYFLRNEPKEDIRERARYPETLPCKK
ncbi:MAG: hypothetical protein GY950_33180, partial [bacterium]|nr:hypothetical protein [bacterium]